MEHDLVSKIKEPDLQGRYNAIKSRVDNEYLRFWQIHAPHFTDHGVNHCQTIITTISEVLSHDLINSFNEYEIFVLLCSIWLHDIGLMSASNKHETDPEIRENHHERSKELIRDGFNNLLLSNESIIIGDISWAHSKKSDINKLRKERIIRHPKIGNQKIRVRFLGAILKFFDGLDICCTRTSEELIEVSKLNELSNFYHSLHQRISGIIRKNNQIIVDINCISEEEYNIFQNNIITPLQYELNTLTSIFAENRLYITDIIPSYNIVDRLKSLPELPDFKEEKIPDDVKKVLQLKSMYLRMFRNNEVEKAKNIIDDLIKIDPDNAHTWYQYGTFYADYGDEEKVHTGFKNALKIEPDSAYYHSLYGHYAGEFLLDIDLSYKEFKSAYELQPSEDLNVLNYAECLITINNHDLAIDLLSDLLKRTQLIRWLIYTKLFIVVSKCFIINDINDIKEDAIKFIDLYFDVNIDLKRWEFNKLTYYINQSDLKEIFKELIFILISAMNEEISKTECIKMMYELFDE